MIEWGVEIIMQLRGEADIIEDCLFCNSLFGGKNYEGIEIFVRVGNWNCI